MQKLIKISKMNLAKSKSPKVVSLDVFGLFKLSAWGFEKLFMWREGDLASSVTRLVGVQRSSLLPVRFLVLLSKLTLIHPSVAKGECKLGLNLLQSSSFYLIINAICLQDNDISTSKLKGIFRTRFSTIFESFVCKN